MADGALIYCAAETDVINDQLVVVSTVNTYEAVCDLSGAFPVIATDLNAWCEVTSASGCSGEYIMDQEMWEAFWPFALLVLGTAFGIKMIRKTIYGKA